MEREGEVDREGDREAVTDLLRDPLPVKVRLTVGLTERVCVEDTVEVWERVRVEVEHWVELPQVLWVELWVWVREEVMDREWVGEVVVEVDTEELKLTLVEPVGVAESPPPEAGLMVPTARWRLGGRRYPSCGGCCG